VPLSLHARSPPTSPSRRQPSNPAIYTIPSTKETECHLKSESGDTSHNTTKQAVSVGRSTIDNDRAGCRNRYARNTRSLGDGDGQRNRGIARDRENRRNSRAVDGRSNGSVDRRRNNNGSRRSLNDRRLRLSRVDAALNDSSSIATSQSQSIGRSASGTTSLSVADAAVGTAAVLRVGADFAVRGGRTAALLAGTAGPVLLDAAGAAVLEVLLRAGDFDDLAN
jgi:hypothetical protein